MATISGWFSLAHHMSWIKMWQLICKDAFQVISVFFSNNMEFHLSCCLERTKKRNKVSHPDYSKIGCVVSSSGIQNSIDVWIKMNRFKGYLKCNNGKTLKNQEILTFNSTFFSLSAIETLWNKKQYRLIIKLTFFVYMIFQISH